MRQRDLKLLATALSRRRACTNTYVLGLLINILNARVIKRPPGCQSFSALSWQYAKTPNLLLRYRLVDIIL